jgi:hypothetical protein
MKTTASTLTEAPKRDKTKEMNFTDVTAGYDTIKGAKNSIDNLDAGANLMNANVDFAGLKTEFERMLDVSKKLKDVQNAKELPETLEDVDLTQMKTEFEGMKDLVTKIKGYDYSQLPNEMKELDLEELETEFTGFTAVADKLADAPIKDKFKDMDFNEISGAYDGLKKFSNRLKMMP